MPVDRTNGDNLKVAYAVGHEENSGNMFDNVGAVDDTLPGAIPRGSEGAVERLPTAVRHAEYVEDSGVPSAAGGVPTQDTLPGSTGALGNVRTSPWGTEDLA